jgi:hypothetical protein
MIVWALVAAALIVEVMARWRARPLGATSAIRAPD